MCAESNAPESGAHPKLQQEAFYSPITDRITMPPRGLFENAEEYWSTFWHEAGHYADFRIMPRSSRRSVLLLGRELEISA
jgi:antirestriction protein ArdC